MSTFDTDPQRALIASVAADPDTGVTVATTGVTLEPASYALAVAKGQTWAFYLKWTKDSTTRDTTAGTPTLVARTVASGTAVVNLTGTGGSTYITFTMGTATTAALNFVRARYVLDYSEGGTVTRLLTGPLDVVNAGLL
jgi:hypothetical protein